MTISPEDSKRLTDAAIAEIEATGAKIREEAHWTGLFLRDSIKELKDIMAKGLQDEIDADKEVPLSEAKEGDVVKSRVVHRGRKKPRKVAVDE